MFVEGADEHSELIGSVRFVTQPSRQAERDGPLTRFEVLLAASVFENEGVRQISGQLIQTEIDGAQTGCSTTETFTGLDRTPGITISPR